MKEKNNGSEIMSDSDARALAHWGLAIASLILLYTGFQGARILTIRGEIGSRTFAIEEVSRSYKIKTRNSPSEYYQCFNVQGEERCIEVGVEDSNKKSGELIETIRIWDGNAYHINDPYLENLSVYLVQFIAFGLLGLFSLVKVVFPRFQILQKFNDTRTVKLFET